MGLDGKKLLPSLNNRTALEEAGREVREVEVELRAARIEQ